MKSTKLKRLFAVIALLCLILLPLNACSSKPHKSGKISIMTTTNVYADIAQNIVGKYGKAEAIIKKSAVDPHDFEPTTNDAKRLSTADIVVANGLGYDGWIDKLASSVDKKTVKVGEDLLNLKKGDNPHIWFDLTMPTKYVNYLVEKLCKMDPKHAQYYRDNGHEYLTKIAAIKQNMTKSSSRINKPVYVSEPVFDYALTAANVKVANQDFEQAIQNNTDPSPATVQRMTEGIKQRKVAFFVVNSQTSSSTVENFVQLAQKQKIPILKVRETIPDNTTYLDWMAKSYQELTNITRK